MTTKRVNDDDLRGIAGGGGNEHVRPQPGGGSVDIRARVGDGTPGGPGTSAPEAEGGSSGYQDLLK